MSATPSASDGDGTSRLLPAPQRSVTNEYWGEVVEDRYQYLEDPADKETQRWSKEESQRSASYLRKLPARGHFAEQLQKIMCFEAPTFFDVRLRCEAGEQIFFAQKRLPPNPQPLVVCFSSCGNEGDAVNDRVLFNSSQIKGTPAVDWFEPSPCGTILAMSLSFDGSERGDTHLLRVATGEMIADDVVRRTNTPTAGGSLCWDGSGGFYYTRHPLEGEVKEEDMDFYQKIYYHKLGTPCAEDVPCLGDTFPRIAECELLASPGTGGHVHCACADGDGGEYAIYVSSGGAAPCREAEGKWRYLAGFKDGVKNTAVWAPDGSRLFMLSRDNAPMGKIVAVDVADLAACSADLAPKDGPPPGQRLLKVVVPERPDVAIEDFTVSKTRLYVSCLVGGPSKIFVFDAASGAVLADFPNPTGHLIFGLIPLPSSGCGDDIYFASMGYTAPRALQRFYAAESRVERTALVQQSPVSFEDVEAITEFCTSKDGTRVPMTIVRRKGPASSPRPCVLYAYGGYGISMVPAFRATLKPWLDLGGIYVVANIRGGAEYGEKWHLEGNLAKKQNVFDDFLAAAEHLITTGHTSRELLTIEGGSNGGLLMGAAMTQRPELFRAVVAHVGIFDSLRTELEPNGVFNIPEFGTVKDLEQYRALRAYSPYHNLPRPPASLNMPSLLLTTGENDGRVASWQSKKFAAALQPLYGAPDAADRRLLLRIEEEAGHGMGTPLMTQVGELADTWAFITSELGVVVPLVAV